MKTNLIFKRQETNNGIVRTVTKIVPVEIPYINSGEGWILSGHADLVEIVTDPTQSYNDNNEKSEPSKTCSVSSMKKFESDVSGTAKLVRSKGVIKIVARRGKSTYNQTTSNSVCINDFTKNEFFKSCRDVHGSASGIFQFSVSDGKPYDYWNTVIDNEYERQKNKFIKNNEGKTDD